MWRAPNNMPQGDNPYSLELTTEQDPRWEYLRDEILKNLNLKLDKLTAGLYSIVVMSQDDSNRGFAQGGGTQVILFHQCSPRDIKKVAFIGPDGQEIAANVSGTGQSGSVYQTYYTLSKKVETCTIRLTAPETIETVNMAVGINTGIGFPPFVSRRILSAPEPRPTVTGASAKVI